MSLSPVRASSTVEVDLVHLTNQERREMIAASGVLHGRRGIFAVPWYVAHEHWLWIVLRTGLYWSRTHPVDVPPGAVPHFSATIPLGPYSSWKWAGEVYHAPPGAIDLTDGTHTSAGRWFGPRALIYGPDVLFYGVAVVVSFWPI